MREKDLHTLKCDAVEAELIELFKRVGPEIGALLPDQPPAGADVCGNLAIISIAALGKWFVEEQTVPPERVVSAFLFAVGLAANHGVARGLSSFGEAKH